MIKHKIVLGVFCAVLLSLSGCSRQQSDWQKTRETNTADAYEQFLKKYPTGEFTAQAQARVKELYEERDWQKARDADTPEAYQAFLKQYPEGKWTEEARIRVENFTLAQVPSGAPTPGTSASASVTGAAAAGAAPASNDDADAPHAPAPAAPPTVVDEPAPARTASAAATKTHAGKGTAGSYRIQLGAFKSGAGVAHKRWAQLRKKYPAQLAGLSSSVSKAQGSAKLYRLQVTGLSDIRARAICSSLKAKSQACIVIPPA